MLASRLFRSGFVLFPMIAGAAYVAACSSDDDPAATPDGNDGGTLDGKSSSSSGDGGGNTGEGGTAKDPACEAERDVVDHLYKRLSCTGLYADFTSKTVADDRMAYKPAAEFWSDGAEKSRWLYLPPGTKIDTTDMNEWAFPVGTEVFKEFRLHGKRVETRLFKKNDDQWVNTTYRWKDDESEAVRLDTGDSIDGGGPDGGVYEIPTAIQCGDCHGGRKDFMLGIDAVSLGLPSATGLTLQALSDKKLITVEPKSTTLATPTATALQGGEKAGPALEWLHINCGSACHNQEFGAGGKQTGLYMRLKGTDLMPTVTTVDKTDVFTTAVCKDSNHADAPSTTVKLKFIRPGNVAKSWLSTISNQRYPAAQTQMPPDYTHAVDHVGHKLLEDWIAALKTPCP